MVAQLLGFANVWWTTGPDRVGSPPSSFDADEHYHYEDLGGSADRDDVMARAQPGFAIPFDRSRPLWQLGIFSGLADGRGALVLKLHHAIADGVGLMLMLAAMADLEPNPRPSGPCRRGSARRSGRPSRRSTSSTFVRHPVASYTSALRSIISIPDW